MTLRDYLLLTKTSVASFATSIGVTAAAAHRYVRDERLPRPQIMVRIEDATNGEVRAADFYRAHSVSANQPAKVA